MGSAPRSITKAVSVKGCGILLLSIAATVAVYAQGGRFEQQKRLGFAYLKDGKFDNAAARLEEVWDFDKSDPIVAEGLSIAYLNGTDRKTNRDYETKAYELMEKAIVDGGKAVFIVMHSHEKLTFLQGHDVISFCSGQLQVRKGRITYISESGDRGGQHSFDLTPDRIKEMGNNFDHGKGFFHIKTVDNRTFNMLPRSRADLDVQFFLELVNKYAKPTSK